MLLTNPGRLALTDGLSIMPWSIDFGFDPIKGDPVGKQVQRLSERQSAGEIGIVKREIALSGNEADFRASKHCHSPGFNPIWIASTMTTEGQSLIHSTNPQPGVPASWTVTFSGSVNFSEQPHGFDPGAVIPHQGVADPKNESSFMSHGVDFFSTFMT